MIVSTTVAESNGSVDFELRRSRRFQRHILEPGTRGPSVHRGDDERDGAKDPGHEVEWANTEMLTIASTLEELQGRLHAEANAG